MSALRQRWTGGTFARTLVVLAVMLMAIPTDARAGARAEARIGEAVAETIAGLELPGTREEFATEKARRAREAIGRGDFALAHDIVREVLAGSRLQSWRFYPFEDFMRALPDVADPAFGQRLDEWVTRASGDPIPALVRAQYFHDLAWYIRGSRFSRDVLREHLDAATAAFSRAAVDADRTIELDDSDPYAFFLRSRILRAQGRLQNLPGAFDTALRKHPGYYRVYDEALAMLQPKWGGSIELMHRFVTAYAGSAPADSPLKLLSVSFYRYLLDAASIACTAKPPENDRTEECITSFVQSATPPRLEADILLALQLYRKLDRYEFGLAIWEILEPMLDTTGADRQSGALLQVLASAMGSDTTLETGGGGRNDYIIDLAVAKSWSRKGFVENALKKATQAVSDAKTLSLGREERSLALSTVYQSLAYIASTSRDYEEAITYAKVAREVGDNTKVGYTICQAYYRLKDLASMSPACSDAILRQPSDLASRYWRAIAAKDTGDVATARRGLAEVAESESSFRQSAAIELSMIYFGEKDLHGALAALVRYRYLYDPNLSSRSDMAVAYNNLCYAQMELKAMDEALDACTESLKFGNIPDAYQKQQRLVQIKAGRATP